MDIAGKIGDCCRIRKIADAGLHCRNAGDKRIKPLATRTNRDDVSAGRDQRGCDGKTALARCSGDEYGLAVDRVSHALLCLPSTR